MTVNEYRKMHKRCRTCNRVMRGFITDNGTRYNFDSIGKSVFLTKEEAEKALAERGTP